MKTNLLIAWFAVCTLSFCSCQNEMEQRNYTEISIAADEEIQQLAHDDPHAGLFDIPMKTMDVHDTTTTKNLISWSKPESWQEQSGSGLRLATFTNLDNENSIDCSIVTLSGQAGGVKANIVRWMQQIGLNASQEELAAFINQLENSRFKGGLSGVIIDFTLLQEDASKDTASMIAAIIEENDFVVFIKMMGSKKAVSKNKNAFLSLTHSLQKL